MTRSSGICGSTGSVASGPPEKIRDSGLSTDVISKVPLRQIESKRTRR